MEALP